MSNYKSVAEIYELMTNEKTKYGTYHKTLFHLHTPASHDYRLLDNWKHEDYVNATEDYLIDLCLERKVAPTKDFLNETKLDEDRIVYASRKEWLAYLLIANELIRNDFEIVVVSDHNNLNGVKKLRVAISNLKSAFPSHKYPTVLFGVEISCADKLHVVGIFDDNNKDSVQAWLDENLINEIDGTYRTSIDVISFFKCDLGCLSYIAHINTSDIFKDDKYLSGAYKRKLKEAGCYEYIGVNEESAIKSVKDYLRKEKVNTNCFLIDNDSHTIDCISKKYFWIKSGKVSFKTVREAFEDFEISVSLHNEPRKQKYIRALLVENGGFLKGKTDDEDFLINFSNSLNCFIGGRGTGKSTVLQLIDYALGQRVADKNMLEFICSHGDIWILFVDVDKEYMIRMQNPTKKQPDDNILSSFGYNSSNRYRFDYNFDEGRVVEYARKNYLKIYEIIKSVKSIESKGYSGLKLELIGRLYDVRYSVNELVQTASGSKIDDFIRQLMFQNKTLSSPEKIISCRSKNGLKEAIKNMPELLKKRDREVSNIIVPFNNSMKHLLHITYRRTETTIHPNFEQWLFDGDLEKHKGKFKKYYISNENVIDYLLYVYQNIGIIDLLKMALNEVDRYRLDIGDFFEKDHPYPNENEKRDAINAIFDNLITNNNCYSIIEYLKNFVTKSEELSLEFNINSHTTASDKERFKDVRVLSLGQKVVAMLDFIFGYGDFINDDRPILIDQPEDNLDSRYIYENLVQRLRNVKNKRQVIIATHNATIVTNAMSDQVCVMESDDKHGWIKRTGYPSEDRIKRDIVNYLEGGINSFKHKSIVYQSVLKEIEKTR